MADTWLPSLITATPQEGFELAITLSRRGVKYTQPDMETLKSLRSEYAQSADGLTAASQVPPRHNSCRRLRTKNPGGGDEGN